jgi:hypothetical protein
LPYRERLLKKAINVVILKSHSKIRILLYCKGSYYENNDLYRASILADPSSTVELPAVFYTEKTSSIKIM